MAASTSRKVGAVSNCKGNKITLKSSTSRKKKFISQFFHQQKESLKIFHGDLITSNLLLAEKLILFHGSENTLNLLLVEKMSNTINPVAQTFYQQKKCSKCIMAFLFKLPKKLDSAGDVGQLPVLLVEKCGRPLIPNK